ncbi:MAG: UDP-glucose/GDP-mannose dehydrogenase family protein [Candidatus Pacebacteria bacterium]|nr:UDP-glucose/GDP-mannose dehydrogenase family protein [Candidatus Paceibacterota bacterium]
MKIAIIGTGYVGLVTGVCLANLGNSVICYDIDKSKIKQLQAGKIPIYESGMKKLLKKLNASKNIVFTNNPEKTIKGSEIIFIAVGTPQQKNGVVDLSFVKNAARTIGKFSNSYTVIVNKSTVPVGTAILVKKIISCYNKNFDIVSNPEFLKEGSAIEDFANPERIIIGAESRKARKIINKLYRSFNCPVLNTSLETAEMIKYASNAFLATKISFINEIANVCEKVNADVETVARGMGLDSRIGSSFLKAGIGYGGSCFPKDIKALHNIALSNNYRFKLLKAVIQVNNDQKRSLVKKTKSILKNLNNKKICLWGLAFKPNTDDFRESAAIDLIKLFQKENVTINAYDPKINYEEFVNKNNFKNKINFYSDKYDALKNCDILLIVTEWNEFKKADLEKIKILLKKPIVIDGRNIYEDNKMKKLGFRYLSVGR